MTGQPAARPVTNLPGGYTVLDDPADYDERWLLEQFRQQFHHHGGDAAGDAQSRLGRDLAESIRADVPCDPAGMGRGLLCAISRGGALLPMGLHPNAVLNVLAVAASELIGDSLDQPTTERTA